MRSSATVTYGHFLNRMRRGELKRILIVATGALLSPFPISRRKPYPVLPMGIHRNVGRGVLEWQILFGHF